MSKKILHLFLLFFFLSGLRAYGNNTGFYASGSILCWEESSYILSQTATPKPETTEKDPSLKENVAQDILKKMRMVNNGLNDYSSNLTVNARVKYSLFNLPVNLDGTYYFKSPDKYKLKINKAPGFLSKYPQVFGWNLPDTKEYTASLTEENDMSNDCYLLKFVPVKKMGDLEKIEMWVNKNSYLFPKQVYYYRNEGRITLDVSYRKTGSFMLFDKVNAQFEFPGMNLSANAEAFYGEYKINEGIPDSIFDEKK